MRSTAKTVDDYLAELPGDRLDVGQSCVRFRKLDDVPFEVIADAIARIPLDEFVDVARKERDPASSKPNS